MNMSLLKWRYWISCPKACYVPVRRKTMKSSMVNGNIKEIMKKISYSILLCVTVMVAGCQSEKMVVKDEESNIQEVFASTEDMTVTKTYMDGTEVLWSSGDQIVAFLGNNLPNLFRVADSSAGSKEARFQKDNSYVITGNNVTILNNVAYYPFSEDIICTPDGSLYKLKYIALPSVQTYSPNSAGNGTYPMVAVTTDTEDVNYRFRNICGAIMFQLKGSGTIKSISIKGNSEEVLCGSASVTASYDKTPSIVMSSDGGKIVTLECGTEGVELSSESPTSFIISLPPVPFTNGFTINVTDINGGTAEYSTSKQNSILRSTILRMPVKEYTGERLPQEGDYIDEYGINHGQGIEIDGVVWAPVNCGYKAETADSKGFPYGKLYQWGRKYGQGYSLEYDESTPIIKSGTVSLSVGQSKDNEGNFYKLYDNPGDWLTYKNDNLWNGGTEDNPLKTEYDPCPEGWRVPTCKELSALAAHSSSLITLSAQRGYFFSGSMTYTDNAIKVFFPAAGCRYGFNGGVVDRNSRYYYWTSKPGGKTATSFQLGEMHDGSRRASGYSVRCVQVTDEVAEL